MLAWRRKQIDPYLSPSTKLRFMWIKDLNIKPDTLNLTEEKMENSLEYITTENNFLNKTDAKIKETRPHETENLR